MLNTILRGSLLKTIAAVTLLGAASIANAQMLNGSLPLAGFNVTQTGADLLTSTDVFATATLTSGPGVNDYAPIPIGTDFGPTDLNLGDPVSYTLSNAVFGSFVGSSFTIVHHTTSFYDVLLLGTYTPGPGLPGFVPTATSLRISINQSGASLSEAITLNSPPVSLTPPTPEPGNVAILTSFCLSGISFLMRRRKYFGTKRSDSM